MKKLLIALFFIPLFGVAQKYDTTRCVMLVCDTSISMSSGAITFGSASPGIYWQFGYEVREKHNTSEGQIDPGFYQCVDNEGKPVSCWTDYWKHIEYLDENKKPLKKSIIVWQAKER